MAKPEHFTFREDTCGTCVFNTTRREYCQRLKRHVDVEQVCEKHGFVLPEHQQFNCWCRDFTKDLGDMP